MRLFLTSNGFPASSQKLRDELLKLAGTDRRAIRRKYEIVIPSVGTADHDTYFVGHSMGCQTIARYLETLPEGIKVGGAVFVAGFFKRLSGLEDDVDVQETDRHWLTAPLDLAKVKSHLLKSVAIFSDDDPWVPLDNQDDFRDKLGSEIVVVHAHGHFGGARDGTKEIPIVLEKTLSL